MKMVSDVSLSCSLDFEVGQLLLHAMTCYALGVLEVLRCGMLFCNVVISYFDCMPAIVCGH